MTRITTAMLLAAGLGTRMKPLTNTLPKPLIEVAGRTLLDRVLDKLVAQGVTRAVVNVHYLADKIEAHLKSRKDIEIIISDERDVLLETGGGVIKALPHLGQDPFFVVNTDVTWATPGDDHVSRRWPKPTIPTRWTRCCSLAEMGATLGFRGPGDFFLGHDGQLHAPRRQANRALRLRRHAHHARRPAARATRSSPSPPTSTGTRWAAPAASSARSCRPSGCMSATRRARRSRSPPASTMGPES
jgi:GTP:adenosylcobinamide-phosphate guanylyltransferase